MKLTKIVSTLCLTLTFFTLTFAGTGVLPLEAITTTVSEEIKTELQKLKLDYAELNDQTIYVRFMVNDQNEMIVLSTNDASLDGTIKGALNYKKLEGKELETFHVYIVPVRFEAT